VNALQELTRQLTETYGPSGQEDAVRALIQTETASLADEINTDALGNLIVIRKATHQGEHGRKVMLAAHMDEIGLVVTHVDKKGFVRFAPVGGVYLETLYGGRVMFANGQVGVLGVEQKELDKKDQHPLDKCFLDVGATSRDDAPVKVGDVAGFWREFQTQGRRWIAKAFDDRIGCAILIQVLRELKESPHELYFVFTVQEEVGLRGATTSAYGVAPEIALAVDVTDTGDTPESPPMAVSLGQGPAIKVRDGGMIAHPGVRRWLIQAAEAIQVPYQLEVLEGGTTDAMAMQVSRAGVPAGTVSIPCRYIHTPSEMVDSQDVRQAVDLLVTALSRPIEL